MILYFVSLRFVRLLSLYQFFFLALKCQNVPVVHEPFGNQADQLRFFASFSIRDYMFNPQKDIESKKLPGEPQSPAKDGTRKRQGKNPSKGKLDE